VTQDKNTMPEAVAHIDIDAISWEQIKQSASKSKWIPKEYFMNDWVSDVCNFLENGTPESPVTDEASDEQKQRALDAEDKIRMSLPDAPEHLRKQYWIKGTSVYYAGQKCSETPICTCQSATEAHNIIKAVAEKSDTKELVEALESVERVFKAEHIVDGSIFVDGLNYKEPDPLSMRMYKITKSALAKHRKNGG
jgi:hypothetical protein